MCSVFFCFELLFSMSLDTPGGGGRSQLSSVICSQSHYTYRYDYLSDKLTIISYRV